jgi:hypothetical protein
MEKELVAIHGPQTAKVSALFIFFFMLLILVPIAIITFLIGIASAGEGRTNLLIMGVIYLVLPLVYLPLMYFVIRIHCWMYNKVAKKFGGIRFTLAEV